MSIIVLCQETMQIRMITKGHVYNVHACVFNTPQRLLYYPALQVLCHIYAP